jgi:proline iminopeptidase
LKHGAASEEPSLKLEDIGRASAPGFRVLDETPEHLIVGAIGRFWEPAIEFADVPPERFAGFAEPGWGKVVWMLRAEPEAPGSRLTIELRVGATDDAAWHKLQLYFAAIGPFSRLIRRQSLARIARQLGTPEDLESLKPLPGDALIAHPKAAVTYAITIDASPRAVWPWLVQMGCRRGGWYSHDMLDNGGTPSATHIVPELQHIAVGDILPARPEGNEGFRVLAIDEPRSLVLGGVVDPGFEYELPDGVAKPDGFWRSTWAFVLEPLPEDRTRLLVRSRVDFAPDDLATRFGTRVLGLVHHFMEGEQLRNLKSRAESSASLHS